MIFYQILSTHSLRKRIETSFEILYVDIRSYRVKTSSNDEHRIDQKEQFPCAIGPPLPYSLVTPVRP